MSALGIVTGTLKNFVPPASVVAGGGASLLVFLAGCALVAANITIPYIGMPITMTMVAAAAPAVGHLVTSLVPDTYNQQINALAAKVKAKVDDIKVVVPQFTPEYPTGKNGATETQMVAISNINAKPQ